MTGAESLALKPKSGFVYDLYLARNNITTENRPTKGRDIRLQERFNRALMEPSRRFTGRYRTGIQWFAIGALSPVLFLLARMTIKRSSKKK